MKGIYKKIVHSVIVVIFIVCDFVFAASGDITGAGIKFNFDDEYYKDGVPDYTDGDLEDKLEDFYKDEFPDENKNKSVVPKWNGQIVVDAVTDVSKNRSNVGQGNRFKITVNQDMKKENDAVDISNAVHDPKINTGIFKIDGITYYMFNGVLVSEADYKKMISNDNIGGKDDGKAKVINTLKNNGPNG